MCFGMGRGGGERERDTHKECAGKRFYALRACVCVRDAACRHVQ